MNISVGARDSNLSRIQVEEIQTLLSQSGSSAVLQPTHVSSTGDLDQITSLRSLSKTDFFTKEIDQMLLNGEVRIAIHSAKDLPDPLPQGLKQIARTFGKDPSDSLVMKEGMTLETLPKGAKIATSSLRREDSIRALRPDLTFCDIRGTIEKRLESIENEVQGVVIAEAALLRLKLNPNRIKIPGPTVPGQGQLAVLARSDDSEMKELFTPLHSPKIQTLYLGLDIHPLWSDYPHLIHFPIIEPKMNPLTPEIAQKFGNLTLCTHLLLTSKVALKCLLSTMDQLGIPKSLLNEKELIVVGKETAKASQEAGLQKPPMHLIAQPETSEGVIQLLRELTPEPQSIFWPHSNQSRPLIREFLAKNSFTFTDVELYTPQPIQTERPPNLNTIREVIFTSPSTVDAFFSLYTEIHSQLFFTAIGPITQRRLQEILPSKTMTSKPTT